MENTFSMWHFVHKVVATNCRLSCSILPMKTYFDGVNSKPFQSVSQSTGSIAVQNPNLNLRLGDSSGSLTRYSIVERGFNTNHS